MQGELDKFKAWMASPVSTIIPLWQMFVMFGVFIVIAYLIWDNQHIIETVLKVPEAALDVIT